MWLAKMLETSLPMRATPTAPPIWRVVSLTAEPTPALSRGNDPMIDSVAGGIVNPMPTDIRKNGMIAIGYGVSTARNDSDNRAKVTTHRPNVITRFDPWRSTMRAENGAAIIMPNAYGIKR